MSLPTTIKALGLMISAALTPHALAQWTTPPVTAPGLQYRTFSSPTANATVSFHIYLPPQYDSDPSARLPVLYWLHGSGSPIAGIPSARSWFANAMTKGLIPPMLVVFPNGAGASMWCNSKDGLVPMESVVINDLIPHIDATFRTIASRSGRIIEGFSMGGAGSGRLGLRRPDLFAGISMLGAGPMQLDFMDAPKGSDVPPENRAALFEAVWGSDPAYYLAQHPWTIITQRSDAHIAMCTEIRIGCGALDAMLPANQDFHTHLLALGVPHQIVVIPGVGHNPQLTLQGLGDAGWNFYNDALATSCTLTADLNCSGAVDGADLAILLSTWGSCANCRADLTLDGSVDASDIANMLAVWDASQ